MIRVIPYMKSAGGASYYSQSLENIRNSNREKLLKPIN